MKQALVLNIGSSTLKWAVLSAADGATVAEGSDNWRDADAAGRARQIRAALSAAPPFEAAGHRVVHGGSKFREAAILDATTRASLDEFAELDPLHMHPALAGIDAVTAMFPALPQTASFDTSFHTTMSEAAAGYALPFEWTEKWNLRRFGFHGLSVAWSVGRVAERMGRMPARLVVAHLGSGASVTAVANGRSADTTMGFSPLEGLMMGRRSGSVDPGLLMHLQTRHGITATEMLETLNERSGLFGVSGVSGDLREVLAAADSGNARARLAVERFTLGVRRAIGAMSGVLGGADAIVFTGGIGENSDRIRREVAGAVTGVRLDEPTNAAPRDDADIAAADSSARVFVIRAREERVILDDLRRLLSAGAR